MMSTSPRSSSLASLRNSLPGSSHLLDTPQLSLSFTFQLSAPWTLQLILGLRLPTFSASSLSVLVHLLRARLTG